MPDWIPTTIVIVGFLATTVFSFAANHEMKKAKRSEDREKTANFSVLAALGLALFMTGLALFLT